MIVDEVVDNVLLIFMEAVVVVLGSLVVSSIDAGNPMHGVMLGMDLVGIILSSLDSLVREQRLGHGW